MQRLAVLIIGPALVAGALTYALPASAAEQKPSGEWQRPQGGMPRSGEERGRPGVVGKVTAISGTTLTVTSQAMPRDGKKPDSETSSTSSSAKTYAVDASNATVTKGNETSSLSAIVIGNIVMIEGTASGTSVTAKSIRIGGGNGAPGERTGSGEPSDIQGDGNPVVGGSVTAISGTTLTVTTKSGTVYAVDASAAKVTKRGTENATISNVATGDTVLVQGTVNGTDVTASSVVVNEKATGTQDGSDSGKKQGRGGFFGAIGGFFTRIFGFF